jgi:hypothetical protein
VLIRHQVLRSLAVPGNPPSLKKRKLSRIVSSSHKSSLEYSVSKSMIQGGGPDKSVFIRARGRKRTSRDDHNPGAMAMERKIFDLKGHAHFVTFSCYRRRRILDDNRAKGIVIHFLADRAWAL